MIKIIPILILMLFLLGSTCQAIEYTEPEGTGVTFPNPLGDIQNISDLLDSILDWLIPIGITLCTIMIIIGGIMFMTAGGSEDKVTRAKKTLTYAVIGLVVLLIAKGIETIILSFF